MQRNLLPPKKSEPPLAFMCLVLAIVCLITLSATGIPAYAAGDQVILKRLMGYVKNSKEHPVWPGYDLTAYTLIYGIGESYYLISAPHSTASIQFDGQAIPTLPGIKRLKPEVVQRFQLAADHVWAEKNIDGKPVFVVKQIAEAKTAKTLDPIHEFLTFLHENFHVTVQESFMYRMANGDERILDAQDFAYTQLEASLLAHLLDETNPSKLKEGVGLYLAVREKHESLIPKAYADYRQGMTVIEGTAQYLTDVFFKRSHPSGAYNHVAYSIPRLKTALAKTQEPDRGRYYVMGAASSHLLDRLMPRWKERFSNYVASLDALLAEAVGYQHRSQDTLRQLGGRYGVARALSGFVAQYSAIAAKEAKEIEEVLKAYRLQGSSRLSLKLPSHLSMGGKWAESWDLPGDRQITRAKLTEVSRRDRKKNLLSLADGIHICNHVSGCWLIELYRNLEPSDILMDGKPLAADFLTATGSLDISQPGFTLHATEARVERQKDGYGFELIKP